MGVCLESIQLGSLEALGALLCRIALPDER
jgi:hypothetical protein